MMGLLLILISIGLKAVGLILVIAIVIVPSAAAPVLDGPIGPHGLDYGYDRLGDRLCRRGVVGSSERSADGCSDVILQGAAFAVSMVAAPRRGAISCFLRVRRDRRDYAAGVLPAEAGLTLPEKRP